MAFSRHIAFKCTAFLRYTCQNHITQANVPIGFSNVLVQNSRNYACKKGLCPPKPRKKRKFYGKYILAGLLVASAATIGYAKYDPSFREDVTQYVPWFDGFVAFIFCEKKSHWGAIKETLGLDRPSKKCPPAAIPKPKRKKVEAVKHKEAEKEVVDCRIVEVKQEETIAEEVVAKENVDMEENVEEIKVTAESNMACLLIETEERVVCDPKHLIEQPCQQKVRDPDIEDRLLQFNVKDLSELSVFLICQYEGAIKKSNDAIKLFKEYEEYVLEMIECSVDHIKPDLWKLLEDCRKTQEKETKRLNCQICDHRKNVQALETLFEEPCVVKNASNKAVQEVRNKVTKYVEDLTTVQETYLLHKDIFASTTEFWNQVKKLREMTATQFDALINKLDVLGHHLDKHLTDSPVLDMFLLEMKDRLIYFDHSIRKLQMEYTCKIKDARVALAEKLHVKTLTPHELTNKAQKVLDDKKAETLHEYGEMMKNTTNKLLNETKEKVEFQACRYGQGMRMKLRKQKKLLQCLLEKEMKILLEKQKKKHDANLEILEDKFSELTTLFGGHAQSERGSREAQRLWLSVRALHNALQNTCTAGVPAYMQLRPLGEEICAIRRAATLDDPLVNAVLATLPDEAIFRGVYTEEALKDRFYRLEKVVRDLALIPESGAPLYMYILSKFQGMLLLKTPMDIPSNELVKDDNLDTYMILQRARYFIDRGNYIQALRYMELLKGSAKCMANEWVKEMKLRLEIVQASKVLMAYATSLGVKYLGIADVQDD